MIMNNLHHILSMSFVLCLGKLFHQVTSFAYHFIIDWAPPISNLSVQSCAYVICMTAFMLLSCFIRYKYPPAFLLSVTLLATVTAMHYYYVSNE